MPKKRRTLIILIYSFFVLSGMTGLIYQVYWSRKLSILFGHTVFAISSILAAFMGGLALGSYLVGKFIDNLDELKEKNKIIAFITKNSFSPHIKMYGIMELIIGVYALLTPAMILMVRVIYVGIMRNFELSLYPISFITFLLSVTIFIIPTMMMGATLPVVLKFVIQTYKEIMEKTARIYSLNTFGAVIGAFLAGFILFPAIGLRATLISAASINIIIGLTAILMDYSIYKNTEKEGVKPAEKVVKEDEAKAPQDELSDEEKEQRVRLYRLVLFVFFISGFTSMVYEVGWTRALALSIGSSTYSFSTILVTFLFGIALGSYLFSNTSLFNQEKITIESLANLELGIGIMALIILPILGFLPYVFLRIFPVVQNSYILIIAGNFLISFLVILPPTILFGVTFPLVVKIYTRDVGVLGKSIGTVYASNTLGNILGSFFSGFALIPLLGVEKTLKLAIFLNIAAAMAIYIATHKAKGTRIASRIFKYALAAVAIFVVFTFQAWRTSSMSLGVSVYAQIYSRIKSIKQFNEVLQKEKEHIVFYRDGISSTVTVLKYPGGVVTLKVNGKNDASWGPKGTDDMHTEWLSGFLPAVLHPNPKHTCVIGFGSGITAAAVNQFKTVETVHSVEIEPVVMEAGKYFDEGNLHVTRSPKFKNHIADGRNFILASKKKFDLIVSEPSNPWIAGIGNLFSKDFYRICYDKLNDKGIYCQWVQTYGMVPETVKMVINTFYSVFPHGYVLITQRGDMMLIGQKQDYALNYQRLKKVINGDPTIKNYLNVITYKYPYQIPALFIVKADRIRAYARGARINTDNHPYLEFDAPKNMYTTIDRMRIVREIFKYRKGDWYGRRVENFDKELMNDPEFFFNVGQVYQRLELWQQSVKYFRRSAKTAPDHVKSYIEWANVKQRQENGVKALAVLNRGLAHSPDNVQLLSAKIHYLKTAGALDEALATAKKALERTGNYPVFMNQVVIVLLQQRKYEDALQPAQELVNRYPRAPLYRLYLGQILLKTGKTGQAEKEFETVLKASPNNAIALSGMGDVSAKKGNWKVASEFYFRARNVLGADVAVLLKLGNSLEKLNRKKDAEKIYNSILRFAPGNVEAKLRIQALNDKQ